MITILGVGPAGLLAGLACRENGLRYRFVSSRFERSVISGAQYLHTPIAAGIAGGTPDAYVRYKKLGSAEGYARKVYGDPKALTSWDTYDGDYPAWSLRGAYERLWALLKPGEGPDDYERNLDWTEFHRLLLRGPVLSTVPRQSLCRDAEHRFDWAKVDVLPLALGDHGPDHEIIYNGRNTDPWYRSSRLFGAESTELPHRASLSGRSEYLVQRGEEAMSLVPRQVIKPLTHNCDCWLQYERVNHVRFLGRYGAWDKSLLINHAYEGAHDFLLSV